MWRNVAKAGLVMGLIMGQASYAANKSNVYIAFKYLSTDAVGGIWGVDDVIVTASISKINMKIYKPK